MTIGIWLPAALLAGLMQAWRTAIQQKLRATLSVSGAGLVRYAYGVPFALVMAAGWLTFCGIALPPLSPAFMMFAAAGGLAQILGTVLLILSFGYRGFVVGTAFSKTEALQAAAVAALVLGERLPLLAWAGIATGVAGVLVLALFGRSLSPREVMRAMGQPAALCGLGAGALFALTGLFVQRATVALAMPDPVAAALVTLAVVMSLQTLMHGGYVALREPATLLAAARSWRTSGQVGLLSALGSACWFTGFATAPVALVRVVGQVEVVFTIGFAHFFLRERTRWHEAVGLLLVGVGVILALAGVLRL